LGQNGGVPIDLFEEAVGVFAALEEAAVDYAVCGALALAVHGVVRATTDIDILVPPDALGAALEAARSRGFDVEALPMRFADGIEVRRVSKISGDETLTLDFLLVNDAFLEVFATRERRAAGGTRMWCVSRDGLIRMKAWANRPRDLDDVARLRETDR
jgi:hypothetical protein